jgi:hypothetical protein
MLFKQFTWKYGLLSCDPLTCRARSGFVYQNDNGTQIRIKVKSWIRTA